MARPGDGDEWAQRLQARVERSVAEDRCLEVYFEHSVISAVARGQDPPEATAATKILRLHRLGQRLRVWASAVSETEIERCGSAEKRKDLGAVYQLLRQVRFVEKQRLDGFSHLEDPRQGTVAVCPMIEDHPWLAQVRPLGLTDDDEHHLLLAAGADAPRMDVFVSRDLDFFNDGSGKDGRRRWIETHLDLTVCLPSELVAACAMKAGEACAAAARRVARLLIRLIRGARPGQVRGGA